MKKFAIAALAMVLLIVMSACSQTATKKQKGTAIGAGGGAVVGALVGQLIGRNTAGTLIGAGLGALVGGLAGHEIGGYMDEQERELQQVAETTDGLDVKRQDDILLADFKGDVLFAYDSATIKPAMHKVIDKVAKVLTDYPKTAIVVEGHTDTQGNAVYNMKLSKRRAQAVKDELIQQGIDPRRIQIIGYGATQPISQEHALNRRVAIVIAPVTMES